MLYDWAGREITQADRTKPIESQLVHFENVDRYQPAQTPGMSPESLSSLLELANQGEPRYQALLAKEILEKDWDTIAHTGVRCAAVTGRKWRVHPPRGLENDAQAVKIAEETEDMLRAIQPQNRELLDFSGLLSHLMGGLLPGYMPAEIIWKAGTGGAQIEGFNPILAEAVTFRFSMPPKLWTYQQPLGIDLAPNKFIVHMHRPMSGDATRGGLIRPLGWMFLFSMFGVKNKARFIEKFGMPFVTARVEENDYDKSRSVLTSMIRNFGTNGGGVFTKAVELQLLEAASSGSEVFFKDAQYWGDAKKLVILGQLASSGESGGLSGGDAQSQVREDLSEHDVTQLVRSIRTDVLRPRTMFTYGENAPVPELCIEDDEDEGEALDRRDKKAKVILQMDQAGWEPKPEDVAKEFGQTFVRKAPTPPTPPPSLQMSDSVRSAPSVVKSKTGTLAAVRAANDSIVANAVRLAARDRVMNPLIAPLIEAMDEAFAGLSMTDEADAAKGLARLRLILKGNDVFSKMDSAKLEEICSGAMFAADANGRAAAADNLNH